MKVDADDSKAARVQVIESSSEFIFPRKDISTQVVDVKTVVKKYRNIGSQSQVQSNTVGVQCSRMESTLASLTDSSIAVQAKKDKLRAELAAETASITALNVKLIQRIRAKSNRYDVVRDELAKQR
eukprot:GHVU01108599.1.p2 GENE.GHVU01108599.1~~GHVU01108599.1.p2  ORF type:complete len:126 (+),score=17.75 GHVU01108599.1:870-1247(+)